MSNLQTRVTRIHLTPDVIFSEQALTVEIDDGGGGEFIVIRGVCREPGTLTIDPGEWPALRDAIDLMIKNVRTEE